MIGLLAQDLAKTFRPPLRLDDLIRGRFQTKEISTRALNDVSLHVAAGEIVGLLGPNGAGKTTLLKSLATLVIPDRGEIWISGHPSSDEDAVKQSIGLVTSEERSFYWRLTGRENLAFFASMHGLAPGGVTERLRELSQLLHLEPFLERRFDAYSSGMKQRLALARSLLHRPRVLLLDEPTRSIDPVESLSLRSAIAEHVRQEGTAVLLVTHNLRELEMLCRRVLVMREGRIVFEGTLGDLRSRMVGSERYLLTLAGDVEDWKSAAGLAQGELRVEETHAELVVDLTPSSTIGDVIYDLHNKGGRVRAVRTETDALEKALQKLDEGAQRQALDHPPKPDIAVERRRPISRLGQLRAFLKRDLRVYLSYRFAFAVGLFGVLFNVAVFFYLAQLVTGAGVPGLENYGTDFFPFVLIGIAFRGYLGVALLQFANALRSEQLTGTLEMLLACPLKISTFLTASTSFTFLYQTLTVAGYILLGLLMGALSLSRMNMPVAALVMVPTIATFAAIGMLSASFLMTFKRGDPVNFFINAASTLFGGVYFPVEVLPEPLQLVSKVLPITYSLGAMRKALLVGSGLREVGYELAVLTGFAIVLVPLGLSVFTLALRKAKRDGTLGQF